jgi:hypothetical protein
VKIDGKAWNNTMMKLEQLDKGSIFVVTKGGRGCKLLQIRDAAGKLRKLDASGNSPDPHTPSRNSLSSRGSASGSKSTTPSSANLNPAVQKSNDKNHKKQKKKREKRIPSATKKPGELHRRAWRASRAQGQACHVF